MRLVSVSDIFSSQQGPSCPWICLWLAPKKNKQKKLQLRLNGHRSTADKQGDTDRAIGYGPTFS